MEINKRKTENNFNTNFDIEELSVDELTEKISEVQQEILKMVNKRKYFQTLPKTKKNHYTLLQCTKLSERINRLQILLTKMSLKKKQRRDCMQKERNWYKTFYKEVSNTWVKKRLIASTNKKMGYTIDLNY